MTPAEHYASAEALIAEAKDLDAHEGAEDAVHVILAFAQVHATLATAPWRPPNPGGHSDAEIWNAAFGNEPQP